LSSPGGCFLSKRTEADFQAWRDQRDWTAQKYAMWKAGERFPSQKAQLDDALSLRRDV
jgi:hypothetical protein